MLTTAVNQNAAIQPAVLPLRDLIVGGWLVSPDQDRVSRDGVSVHVRPKLMDLLVYLARNAGRTVPHDELRASVWPDQPFIAGTVLPRCIAELRQTLGDHAADSTVIQTIPKRGYRLIAEVRPSAGAVSVADAAAEHPTPRLSAVRSASRPAQARRSLAAVPRPRTELRPPPVPARASHGLGVAAWLRRARLIVVRLRGSFQSRAE